MKKKINANLTLDDKLSRLFQIWIKRRKINESNFTYDGPQNTAKWESLELKILFLLKEAYNGFEPAYPIPPEKIKKTFFLNIVRWRALLQSLYFQPNKEAILLNNDEYSELIEDIAIVEVKKNDEGNRRSVDSIIESYARRDKCFLKKEIDLINPHVVICGGTFKSYNIIYELNDNSLDLKMLSHGCYNHKNRLVIKSYHPSYNPHDYFFVLEKMIIDADIHNNFTWK